MKNINRLQHPLLPQSLSWHPRFAFLTMILTMLFVILSSLASAQAAPIVDDWAFADRDYRMPLSVAANGFVRHDQTAKVAVDFGQQLIALGAVGSFDAASLRVVEVAEDGAALNTAVSFQFDNGSVEDNPIGTLLFLVDATTNDVDTRFYHVYFDTTGSFTPPPAPIDRVQRLADTDYQGQMSFVIGTHDANGDLNSTYYYHQEGAAFASIFDRDNNDWVGYSPDEPQSRGAYRGIPNLGKVFHPGYANSTGYGQGSNSVVVEDGPLKLTIRSVSYDGEWEAVWDIYPTYAEMTLVAHPADRNYWMLYKGTPGGQLDYTGFAKDYMVLADGSQIDADMRHKGDIDGDWVYFADGAVDRSLFLAHGPDDDIIDSYKMRDDFHDDNDSNDMTHFGFGYDSGNGASKLLSADGATLTIGLVDDRAYDSMAAIVEGITQELIVTIGNEAPEVVAYAGLNVGEGQTAVFTSDNLFIEDPEGGAIIYTVDVAPTNGTLFLNGQPLAVGDTFTQADILAGNLSYEHDGSETTADSFTVTPSDYTQDSEAIEFSIEVTAVNDPPNTILDIGNAEAGIACPIDLLQNDSDPDGDTLTVASFTQPTHGAVTIDDDGIVTYTPNTDFIGSDSFTYWASDGSNMSIETMVTMEVTEAMHQLYLPIISNN